MIDKVMKAKMKQFNEIGFGNQAIIPGGKYGAKRVELKDWLTTALSQAQAEARGEMLLKDWNDIPKKQQKEFINDMEILTPWGIYCYFKIALKYQLSYLNKLSKEKKI